MKWIKMGWGHTKKFFLDFRAAKDTDKTPLRAAIDAVLEITSTYPGPYTLMVSGGVDSQAMLWAWYKSGAPFKAVSVEYLDREGNKLNMHDFAEMNKFCEAISVKIQIIQFNMIDFLESELSSYVKNYQCTSPQICAYMKMSEMIPEGTVIFSGNFLSNYQPHLNYTILGLHRYTEQSRRPIIPFFFMHTADLASAFRKSTITPTGYDAAAGYKMKCDIYHEFGFPVIPQEQKFSGFEKIKDYYDEQHNKTPLITKFERLCYSRLPSKRVFDIVFRYRNLSKVKYEDDLDIIF